MNEEELQRDILFQIDMQLYDEFNDKLCEINEHLGDIYSYKDLDDVEKAEKEKEIKLLREAIKKQQKEIELMKTKINKIVLMIKENYNSDFYDDYETIAGLRDDIYNLLMKK